MARPRRLAHHARWSRSASADPRSSRLLSSIEHKQQQENGEAKVVVAPRNMVGIGSSEPEPEPSAVEHGARAERRRLVLHAGWSRSALAQLSRSKPPSSIEPEQQQGNGEAKEAGVSRKTVAISTNAPKKEHTEYGQAAVEHQARAAAIGLQSAPTDPSRGSPPSSTERKQQQGDSEAKAAGASRNTVAIGTNYPEYEHTAVELRARVVVRQR